MTQLYNKGHYNAFVSYRSPALADAIGSFAEGFYSLRLVDPCLLPEKQMDDASRSIIHGDGLFGVNYARLDQYVYLQNERVFVASEKNGIGFLSPDADILFVKDVQMERAFHLEDIIAIGDHAHGNHQYVSRRVRSVALQPFLHLPLRE